MIGTGAANVRSMGGIDMNSPIKEAAKELSKFIKDCDGSDAYSPCYLELILEKHFGKKIDLIKFESPIPYKYGKDYESPKDCVELIIYDDDGPEGFFRRFKFARSSEAIELLFDALERKDLKLFNFTLTNHWEKK
jgi:hypothetical protein